MNADQAKALRAPFPDELIGRLPKGGVMLSFVGHAAATDRLLQVDPEWTWEPFAVDESGLPKLDENGGLWIRLTICGVTRPGYGDAVGKKGPNAVKEAIGDAIRNGAMRFGVALDLWSKEDLVPTESSEHSNGHTAPPVSDVVSLRAQIWNVAKSKSWDMAYVEADFAKENDNTAFPKATAEQLASYLKLIRDGATT